MTKILSKLVLWTQKLLLIPGTKKKTGEKRKRKGKWKKKGLGENSVFEVIESEPSEREARETCERMRGKKCYRSQSACASSALLLHPQIHFRELAFVVLR